MIRFPASGCVGWFRYFALNAGKARRLGILCLLLTRPCSVNETFQWIKGDGWCFNYLQIYPNIVGEYALRELRPHSAHYSEELMWWNQTPLFVLPSICGRVGSAPVADPHIHRPYWSLLLWISGFVSESGRPRLEPPQPVMAVTRLLFGSGSEAGTRPLSAQITQPRRQWSSLPFMLCRHHYSTLFPPTLRSRRSSFPPVL